VARSAVASGLARTLGTITICAPMRERGSLKSPYASRTAQAGSRQARAGAPDRGTNASESDAHAFGASVRPAFVVDQVDPLHCSTWSWPSRGWRDESSRPRSGVSGESTSSSASASRAQRFGKNTSKNKTPFGARGDGGRPETPKLIVHGHHVLNTRKGANTAVNALESNERISPAPSRMRAGPRRLIRHLPLEAFPHTRRRSRRRRGPLFSRRDRHTAVPDPSSRTELAHRQARPA